MGKFRLSSRMSRKDAGPAKHNSRTDFIEQPKHIDPTKENNNWYWTCIDGEVQKADFQEMELNYYKARFGKALEKQNNKHKKNRQYKRCKEIKDIYNSKTYKPEEVILQVGDMNNSITKDELLKIYKDFYNWHIAQFPEVTFLNAALHDDEMGAPHVHIRRVWESQDDDGTVKICQSDVLKKHNIERPDTSKKEGRYNNPKMTYTKQVREKLLQICIDNGIDIEMEIVDSDAKHLHPDEYKKMKIAQSKLKDTIEQLEKNTTELKDMDTKILLSEMDLNALQSDYEELQNECLDKQNELEQLNSDVQNLIKVMTDDNYSCTFKNDQAQLVYNQFCNVRDKLKREKKMTDDIKIQLEEIRNFTKTTIDYIQGYKNSSYSNDPFINAFITNHQKEFDDFTSKEKDRMNKINSMVNSIDINSIINNNDFTL